MPHGERLRALLLVAGSLLLATCDDGPTRPSKTIIIPYPTLACPAPITLTTTTSSQTFAVATYTTPVPVDGTAPVTTTCAPASGSRFDKGTTTVTCSAVDHVNRTGRCTFAVTVLNPPTLRVRKILAFGDSITAGEVPAAGEFPQRTLAPHYVELNHAYPTVLADVMRTRYTDGPIVTVDGFRLRLNNETDCDWNAPALPPPGDRSLWVINAGCLGAQAQSAETLNRLQQKISYFQPDVLLLMMGTNDLDDRDPRSIPAAVAGVQRLASAAWGRGLSVIVGTIPPQVEAWQGHGGAPRSVGLFNAALVPAVTAVGADVVDVYAALSQDPNRWISQYDGLHPNADGYAEIARRFYERIRDRFEQ
jgi:lysophospholipase L1-like esterase